ncbi:MAG: hypothetical protein QXI09_01110 [Candidatus Aenigmatarchaeota archaeon]
MGLKSIIFSIEMILGISLISIFMFLYFQRIYYFEEDFGYEKNFIQAKDLVNVLKRIEVKNFADKPTIKSLIDSGILKIEDLEISVLDLIGSLWFSGYKEMAKNFTMEVLENITQKCVRIDISNETLYSSCDKEGKNLAASYTLISGYEIGKPVSGYIARAWAKKFSKNTTKIIPFYPEGSGWTGNRLEITKNFELPQNITINSAILFVSIHFGTSKSQAQFQQLVINGRQKKNDVIWLYLQEEVYGSEITTAAYGYVDVTNDVLPGNNSIYLVIGTPFYHSHTHPGMRLIINYSLIEEMSLGNKSFYKRYYFDNVVGYTGSWSMVSFYIPENAKNVRANLNLNLKDVEDTRYFTINTTDIRVFINSDKPFYSDGVGDYCYYYRDGGYYCKRDIVGKKDVRLSFNITNQTKKGTNVISVYVNCYGDIHWGDKQSIIYSDPLNDPENSSYVEVYYEIDEPLYSYGEIDITKEKIFGGNASNPKIFYFNISEKEKKMIESFVHIAQGFSSMINVTVYNSTNLPTHIFLSPSPRVVPENVFINPKILSVGNNTIRLVDVQPNGGVSLTNYILPWSSFEYTYLVKGMVGYGNVFANLEDARIDAINRLITELGEEGIVALNIEIDTQSVQGIRWLWGPTRFRILIWDNI